jgi:hypothetical protein
MVSVVSVLRVYYITINSAFCGGTHPSAYQHPSHSDAHIALNKMLPSPLPLNGKSVMNLLLAYEHAYVDIIGIAVPKHLTSCQPGASGDGLNVVRVHQRIALLTYT